MRLMLVEPLEQPLLLGDRALLLLPVREADTVELAQELSLALLQ